MSRRLTEKTALYKVIFNLDNQEHQTELILYKKQNKNIIRKILSSLIYRKYSQIKDIKLRFRKYISGFSPDFPGNLAYLKMLENLKCVRNHLTQKREITPNI